MDVIDWVLLAILMATGPIAELVYNYGCFYNNSIKKKMDGFLPEKPWFNKFGNHL